MATPQFKTVSAQEDFASTKEYVDYLAGILSNNFRELMWLVTGNLDVANIKAKSITADRMSVKELSAITANLGTVTAGSITSNTVISVGTDIFVGNFVRLGESDFTGQKGITFSTDSGISAKIEVQSGDMTYRNDGFVSFNIGSTQGMIVNKKVTAPQFAATSSMTVGGVSVALSSDINSLQSQINTINSNISSLQASISNLDSRVSALEGGA